MAQNKPNLIKGRSTQADVKQIDTPFEASIANDAAALEAPYNETQRQYRKFILGRMTDARTRRESPQIFYNWMTYTDNYRANMLAANSYTAPRQNAEDTQVVTGTTREKILAIVSSILNLNFETEFRAFDEDDTEEEVLGEAMTDVVERANKMELWDDKKLYAYYEMAVQGDVYIQETYVEETVSKKKRVALGNVTEDMYKQDFNKDAQRQVSYSGCRRSIIPGTQVYKGSMTIRQLKDQPYLFTREVKSYEYTKSLFSDLPYWKYVPRRLVQTGTTTQADVLGVNWRLEPIMDEQCEILIYRDRFNREYNLIINGVLMLPAGFGFPWNHDDYDLVQGSLEPMSAFFSESKSIPAKTKLDQEILDEMYRLAILKTQKSFMPPIANYSQNILSRSMFLPGKINNSLSKGEIEVLGGDPGQYSLKPSEFEMINMIKKFIDEKSVDPILQGQGPQGDVTATQVSTVTQQAKQKLGIIIFGFMQFHMNLDMLRLYTVLDNYTKASGTKVNDVKTGIEDKYRTISISKDLGSQGHGVKKIQFTNKHSRPDQLYDIQEGITRDNMGKPLSVLPPKTPMRILQLSPEALRSIKYTWFAEVTPKEKETSLAGRIEFEDRLTKAMQLFGVQSLNITYAQEQWAVKNKLNPELLFNHNQQTAPGAATTAPAGPGNVPAIGPAQESPMQKQKRPYASSGAEGTRQGFQQ